MNKNVFATAVCLGLSLGYMSLAQANDKVEKIYNTQTIQHVCKGKHAGDAVSFAARGILWNGTCETQFIPMHSKMIQGNENELYDACQSDPHTKMATINGHEVKGKCALAFTPPRPKQ
ncbi:hypothetical protein ACX1NX_02140 [Acinetobacter sp. ANC 5383]